MSPAHANLGVTEVEGWLHYWGLPSQNFSAVHVGSSADFSFYRMRGH
jgi:hypothetical protein